MTIGGVKYEFVGNSFSDYRVENYSDIDTSDPLSYIHAFVRDGILNEQDLNLGGNSREAISFTGLNRQRQRLYRNTITFVDQDAFYVGRSIYATSYQSTCPGYILTINEQVWNTLNDFAKRRLMYHEFGHALLSKEHVCEATSTYIEAQAKIVNYESIMLGGECSPIERLTLNCPPNRNLDGGFTTHGYIERLYGPCGSGYDFSQWRSLLSHFYDAHIPLRPSPCVSGKGQINIIHD